MDVSRKGKILRDATLPPSGAENAAGAPKHNLVYFNNVDKGEHIGAWKPNAARVLKRRAASIAAWITFEERKECS